MKTKTTFVLLAGMLLVPLNMLHAADTPQNKPNIVLIFIDDMGYADIGPFGNPQAPLEG